MSDFNFDYRSLFGQLTALSQDAIVVLNREGRVLYINDTFRKLYGWTLQELQKIYILPFIEIDSETLKDKISKILCHEEILENIEATHTTKDGQAIQLSISCAPVRYGETFSLGLIAIMRDITGKKAIHNVIERTLEPVFIHNHGVIIYMNQACAKLLKSEDPDSLLGSHIFDFIHEDFVELMQQRTKYCYSGEEVDTIDIKIVVENEVLWVTISPSPVLFRGEHCTQVSLRDVTAEYARQNKLEQWAFEDPLTNLPNRRYFIQFAEQKLTDWEKYNISQKTTHRGFAMMSLDCDDFKQINDTLGHDIGDQVLEKIGQSIQRYIRKTDIVSRIGGDEFLIFFGIEQGDEEIHSIVNNLLAEINQEWEFNSHSIKIGVSHGLVYHAMGETLHELIKRADRALYKAKRERLTHHFCNERHPKKFS